MECRHGLESAWHWRVFGGGRSSYSLARVASRVPWPCDTLQHRGVWHHGHDAGRGCSNNHGRCRPNICPGWRENPTIFPKWLSVVVAGPSSDPTRTPPACSASPAHLQAATMLRRFHSDMVEYGDTKAERKKSKRQRIIHFFRWRKQKPQNSSERAVRPTPLRTHLYITPPSCTWRC